MIDANVRTLAPDGTMTFEFSKVKAFLSGKERIAQKLAKALLTTRGSHAFFTGYGASILAYAPKTLDSVGSNPEIRSAVSRSISDAQAQVMRSQIGQNLGPSETLVSANLLEIRIDSNRGLVEVDVKIVTLEESFVETVRFKNG